MSSTRTSSAKSGRKQRVVPCTPEDSSGKSTANVVERSTDDMTSGKSGTDTKPALRSNKIAPKAHLEAERPPDEGQTDGQTPVKQSTDASSPGNPNDNATTHNADESAPDSRHTGSFNLTDDRASRPIRDVTLEALSQSGGTGAAICDVDTVRTCTCIHC